MGKEGSWEAGKLGSWEVKKCLRHGVPFLVFKCLAAYPGKDGKQGQAKNR